MHLSEDRRRATRLDGGERRAPTHGRVPGFPSPPSIPPAPCCPAWVPLERTARSRDLSLLFPLCVAATRSPGRRIGSPPRG